MQPRTAETLSEPTAVARRLRAPLYHQIYLILRQKICDGAIAFGDLLPSEQEIAQLYAVSRITAKRALDELAADGLVVRERGRGTTVSFQPPAAPIRSSVEGLLENLLMMGLKSDVRLLEFDYLPASSAVARSLRLAPGETVQRAVRVRSLEGKPFSHLTTYVPGEIGCSYSRDDLAATSLLSLLERCGLMVSRADQVITATLADTAVAPLLDTEIGAPLLQVRRTVFDQHERPVEDITALYRPDLYQYRMVLTRVKGERHNTWSPTG